MAGISFNVVTLFCVLTNFGLLLYHIIKESIESCKEKCKRKQQIKEPDFTKDIRNNKKVKLGATILTVIHEDTNEDLELSDEKVSENLVYAEGEKFTLL